MMLRLLEWAGLTFLILFLLVIGAAGIALLGPLLAQPPWGPVVAIAVLAFIVFGAWAAKDLRTRWAQWRGLGVNLAEEPPNEYRDPDIQPGLPAPRRFNEPIDPQEARWRLPD